MENSGDDKNKVSLLKRKGRVKKSYWAAKATLITFITSAFFSVIAETTESNGNLIVISVLLLFLIVGNVVFDGIGIAAATADEKEILRLSKNAGRSGEIAVSIVENADIVSNVCNDVIGDIFGILAGACTVVISASITKGLDTLASKIVSVAVSAVISAIIVGGKAALKNLSITKSNELVMMFSKVLSELLPKKRKRKNENNKKNKRKI